MSRSTAEEFVDSFGVPWPCGYGAELSDIAAFGAYNPYRMSEAYNPGYEVSPTVYLIDSGGRVLWHDGQARPSHAKGAPDIAHELSAEIDRALRAGG